MEHPRVAAPVVTRRANEKGLLGGSLEGLEKPRFQKLLGHGFPTNDYPTRNTYEARGTAAHHSGLTRGRHGTFPEARHFAAQRSRLQHKTSQTIVWLTRWGLGEADTDLPRSVDWIIWCTRFCDRADETTLRRSFGGRHSQRESQRVRKVPKCSQSQFQNPSSPPPDARVVLPYCACLPSAC